jgi:hypothetical protein
MQASKSVVSRFDTDTDKDTHTHTHTHTHSHIHTPAPIHAHQKHTIFFLEICCKYQLSINGNLWNAQGKQSNVRYKYKLKILSAKVFTNVYLCKLINID